MTQGTLEKDILKTAAELGELISGTNRNFEEAWSVAGKLNNLLKTDDIIKLPQSKLSDINSLLQSYYKHNRALNDVRNKMYGVGKKLLECVG